MKKSTLLFIASLFIVIQLQAQVDSLFKAYKIPYKDNKIQSWDTNSVSQLLKFCAKNQRYHTKLSDSIVSIFIKSETKIKDTKARLEYITQARLTKANCQMLLGNYTQAEKQFKLVANNKNVDPIYQIKAESNLGVMYYFQEEYSKALENYLSSMEKAKKLNQSINSLLINICIIYQILNNSEKQLYYSELALKESIRVKDSSGIAYSYNSLGLAHQNMHNSEKAIVAFKKAISFSEKINEFVTISDANINLGNAYTKQKKHREAIKCFKISLAISKDLDKNLFFYYSSLSSGYTHLNDLKTAKLYSDSSRLYLKMDQPNMELADFYKNEGTMNYKLGLYRDAYDYLELSNQYTDSVISEENKSKINNLQQEYLLRSSKLEDSLKFALKEKGIRDKNALVTKKKNAELKLQRNIIFFSIAFAVLLFGTIIYVFRMYKTKKKANEIIADQKRLAERQKAEITEKNNALTDSINYAKNLQDALLPSEPSLTMVFPSIGLVYLPKDIVSGDFYWIHQKDHFSYIAVADCTGHGVPGAMMSLIGISGLERCVKENMLSEPAEILNQLNELVEKTFASQHYNINDGMDISLIKINTKTREVSYAGAYSPLWVFSEKESADLAVFQSNIENNFMYTFNADKQPIGKFRDRKPFTQQDFILPENAKIVLLTDGYADQFGGENGKKLKYQAFRKLISENYSLSPMEITQLLTTHFNSWKQNHEQVDDVTVIVLEV